jgi:hypothetical protein
MIVGYGYRTRPPAKELIFNPDNIGCFLQMMSYFRMGKVTQVAKMGV